MGTLRTSWKSRLVYAQNFRKKDGFCFIGTPLTEIERMFPSIINEDFSISYSIRDRPFSPRANCPFRKSEGAWTTLGIIPTIAAIASVTSMNVIDLTSVTLIRV